MKLRFLLLNALFCLAMSTTEVWAVPAKPGVWRFITLTDGSEVRARLLGDEFQHYYESEDGTKYMEDSNTGLYNKVANSPLRKASARRARALSHQQNRMRKLMAQRKSPFQGKKKGLIILAEFADSKFQAGHDQALYDRIANEQGFSEEGFRGSVKDYFRDQSLGQFELDFDVVGICPLKNNTTYYGRNLSNGDDAHAGEMVAEACLWAAQQGTDFSQYDWDGDGEVDQVFVLYAGQGEAAGGASSTIWPHMFYLSSSDYGKALTMNGVKVDTYACSCELNMDSRLDGIGTFCHEFSHCMGFPDLYDTNGGSWFGMGDYDLMSSGSYNGDCKCPAGYSAYEKNVCGWIDLTDVTHLEGEQKVTGLKALSEGGNAYVIYNLANENEYYIVENRQKTNWDAGLPDSGVLITHVDFNQDVWDWNVPNSRGTYYVGNVEYTNDHQRLTMFHADGKRVSSSDRGHVGELYGNGYSSLTATTNPASTLYNMNGDGSYYMHIDIQDMVVKGDGTASLSFVRTDHGGTNNPDSPVVPSGSTLLYESFDKCAGTGGNDGLWKGNIAGVKLADEDLDNKGWSSTGSIYEANGCIRLGKSGMAGDVTTPVFVVSGSATLSFKAAAWNGQNDASKLYLEITDVNTGARKQAMVHKAELSKSAVPLKKGEWSQFGVSVYASGNVKITFTADQGRFFLDEVRVQDNSINDGISTISNRVAPAIEGYYTIDGVRLASPRPGVCIIRYTNGAARKVIVCK